jgi:hypothetical protein
MGGFINFATDGEMFVGVGSDNVARVFRFDDSPALFYSQFLTGGTPEDYGLDAFGDDVQPRISGGLVLQRSG